MARRTKEEARQTRERILDAAIDVFHEHGVARPSLSQVAKLAGVTRGAVYGHFQNKADLFFALCDRVRLPTEVMSDASPRGCRADPLGKLRDAWVGLLRQAATDPKARRIFDILFHRCELVAESGLIQPRMQQGYQESLERMAALLARAVELGQLPADLDVDAAAPLLHGSLIGVLQEWLFRANPYDLAACADRYVDALLEMVRTSPALRRMQEGVEGESSRAKPQRRQGESGD